METASFALWHHLAAADQQSTYIDKTYGGTEEDYRKEVLSSGTLYVGNLQHQTREEQMHVMFSQIGRVKRAIMGLDANRHVPCGFGFIEFWTPGDAVIARRDLSKNVLNDRHVYLDLDGGFAENRQFGRGEKGGQIREEEGQNRRKRRRPA
ncbi:nuclear cap-binding protein subunit 2 [Nematocida homosporus]|uniref:nuclear cap-binding protein subunit 2 n=1 Tax=Nematocida homosporus TaxID=1912981 RepID=UPI00221EA1AD|nr:nuclear cap-binding protein subunit 2 [Nematocida homosporus]KAI5186315.1 nuclear cap-binding protein subunit 2 [Nematocida homosporus]